MRAWVVSGALLAVAAVTAAVIYAKITEAPAVDPIDTVRALLKSGQFVEATPTDMVQAYRNEVEGDRRYKGKAIRLTGTVDAVRRDPDGGPVAILHTWHEDSNSDSVACILDGDYNLAVGGPKVVLRGVAGPLQHGAVVLGFCRPE